MNKEQRDTLKKAKRDLKEIKNAATPQEGAEKLAALQEGLSASKASSRLWDTYRDMFTENSLGLGIILAAPVAGALLIGGLALATGAFVFAPIILGIGAVAVAGGLKMAQKESRAQAEEDHGVPRNGRAADKLVLKLSKILHCAERFNARAQRREAQAQDARPRPASAPTMTCG